MADLVVTAGLDASAYHRGLREMRDAARLSTGDLGRSMDGFGARIDGLTAPLRKATAGISAMLAPFGAFAAIGGTVVGVFSAITAEIRAQNAAMEENRRAYERIRQRQIESSQDRKIRAQFASDPVALAVAQERVRLQRELRDIEADMKQGTDGWFAGTEGFFLQKDRLNESLRRAREESAAIIEEIYKGAEEGERTGLRSAKDRAIAEAGALVAQAKRAAIDEIARLEDDRIGSRAIFDDAENNASEEEIALVRRLRAEYDAYIEKRISDERKRQAEAATAEARRVALEAERAAAEDRAREHATDALRVDILRAQGRTKEAELLRTQLDIAERIAEVERDTGRTPAERAAIVADLRRLGALQESQLRSGNIRAFSAEAGTSGALIERVVGPQANAARALAAQQQTARIAESIQRAVQPMAPLLQSISNALREGVPAVAG